MSPCAWWFVGGAVLFVAGCWEYLVARRLYRAAVGHCNEVIAELDENAERIRNGELLREILLSGEGK